MIKIDTLSQYALDIMESTGDSLFLTGKAGTGKTTLLKHFLQETKKNVIVLASTGVAAINIGGSTVHSFFRFGHHVSPDSVDALTGKHLKLLAEADTIVIDEVSMVRADLMDCIDIAMRAALDIPAPFGGKQMIFVGDLYQLPPVVSNYEMSLFREKYQSAYFFASGSYQELHPHVVSLQKVYRQNDQSFAHILNKIRIGLHSREDLDSINECCGKQHPEHAIYLTTTNYKASEINQDKLDEIQGVEYSYDASISGKISASMYPNATGLTFKVGAQVMMIKNSKGFSNGTIGTIVGYDEDLEQALIEMNDREFVISPHTWQVLKPEFDKELNEIIPVAVGSFKQFPFKLAWAITVHKAQGLTFDEVVVDLGEGSFANGQSYVALSRATSLDGLYLPSPVRQADILVDRHVKRYMHEALWDQTSFLVHTALEQKKSVEFLYNDPVTGPRIVTIEPEKIGYLEHSGHSFKGLIGKEKDQSIPYSYGRIFNLGLAS